jgi:hypothetical protein
MMYTACGLLFTHGLKGIGAPRANNSHE